MAKDAILGVETTDVTIGMTRDVDCEYGLIRIDGVLYHFERIPAKKWKKKYGHALDPEITPRTNRDGKVYVIIPFGK